MISDILPHLGKDQEKKTRDEFFPAEDLDVIAWTTYAKAKKGDEDAKGDKPGLVAYLKRTYKVDEADLMSAELEIVPAGMPREVGLDRALIAGYGHVDRVCSFAALQALLDAADDVPVQTASILMCDKEEVGSMGSTGMQSSFFENTVAELIERQEKDAKDIMVRRALEKSSMLSADVSAVADPHFPDVDSTGNSARFHRGPCASKYTGGTSKGGASDCRLSSCRDPAHHGRGRGRLADGRARQAGEGRWRNDFAVHGPIRHEGAGHGHTASQHARALGTCVQVRLLADLSRVQRLS